MSPSALLPRLLVLALSTLALTLLPAAGASAQAQPCFASLSGAPPGQDGRFQVEAGDVTQGTISCFIGPDVTFSVHAQPAGGSVTAPSESPPSPGFQSATFTYTPDADFSGPDQFTLRVSEGPNHIDVVVRINVRARVDDPPVCPALLFGSPGPGGVYTVEAGMPRSGFIGCTDDEGVDLTFSVFDGPDHGTLSPPQELPISGIQPASFTYTPDVNHRGTDAFTLRASDGTNHTDRVVEVNVVEELNDPPVCNPPGTIAVEQGRTLPFNARTRCFDPEGDPLTLTITQQPTRGSMAGPDQNGFFTYTAPTNYVGPDSFGVEISDGVNTLAATVGILVVAVDRLVLTPAQDTPEVGATHTVTATVRDTSGMPQAGKRVRWRIAGAGAEIIGDALTNAFGQLEISWIRAAQETDSVTAHVDDDDDGVKDASEPQELARAHWRAESDVAPPDAGPPTTPGGDPLDVKVGEYLNPQDPGERYFTVSLSETTARGVTPCPGVPGSSREMNLPISVAIEPGAGTVVAGSVQLFQVASGAATDSPPLTPPGVKSPVSVNGNTYTFVLDCIRTGDLYVRYSLTEGGPPQTFTVPLGGIVLIDPQGVVYDKARYDARIAAGDTEEQARNAAAIGGAKVTLQRKVGDDFVTVLSGDPGISPHVNPQTTGADGKFQWDVSAGVYRVVVSKEGYNTTTSRETTIPPPELALHVALEAPGGGGGGGGGGTGGGGVGGGAGGGGGGGGAGGAGGGPTIADLIASVTREAAQSAKALAKCGTTGLLARAGCTDTFTALEDGTVAYRLTAPAARAGAAATTVLASGKRAIPAAGSYKVMIKATKKGRKRLKKAAKLRAKVAVTFTDSDGNAVKKSKKVVLKRKK